MVLNDSLSAIVEAVYLGESITSKVGNADILVNPEASSYIAGKTVIISDPDYPEEKIKNIEYNGNRLILRVPKGNRKVYPYIVRVNFDLMWNGQVISDLDYLEESCSVLLKDYDQPELYFPKIKGYNSRGGWLDWALHQVGQNSLDGTRLRDLDVLKLKKARL